jgi:DNA-binding MarR family transcriptional regulator
MPAATTTRVRKRSNAGDEDLVSAVVTASRVLVGVAARSLAGFAEEVTIPQYRALVLLAYRGSIRPVDLADALAITTSTVTRLCDRIERKGLVTRTRDREDRREVWIALTVAGRRMVEQVMGVRQREIERILESVPERDRRGMLAAFRRFAEAAGEVPESSGSGWEL